jgi:hypothetical protein
VLNSIQDADDPRAKGKPSGNDREHPTLNTLHDKADNILSEIRDIEALGSALLHVLGNVEDRHRHGEPLTTAISLAGMIQEMATVQANAVDELGLGLCRMKELAASKEATSC